MRVAISGCAFASPFGSDFDTFWQGLCQGPMPIATWHSEPNFPGLGCRLAALPGADHQEAPGERTLALSIDLGRQALASAGLIQAPRGTGLALGSAWMEGDILGVPPRPPGRSLLPAIASTLGLTGPITGTPIACASSNYALAWAYDRLRAGDCQYMLAGGVDVAGPMAIGGYLYLDVMTDTVPRPFAVNQDGFLLSEGGAFFLLEPLEQARAAGRRVWGEIVGTGTGHDASHPTRTAPDGRGLAFAMRRALQEAGLSPDAIDYLNAHSPGTAANDAGEAAAIHAVFGSYRVPVSSTKGSHGHAQGGANALEALACLLALRHQVAPPTLHVDQVAEALGLDVIVAPRPMVLQHVLSLASCMGGANAAVIFARGDKWG